MTLFKDIRNGYPVHVLTRSEEDGTIEYLPCNVVNVAPPYFPTSQYANGHLPTPPMPFTPNTQNTYNRVMDITIQVKEKTTTYTVGENSCLSEAPGGILIATDRDLIIKELENINSKDYHTNPMYEKLLNFRNLQEQQKKKFSVEDLLRW